MATLACIGSFDPAGFFILAGIGLAGLFGITGGLLWLIGQLFG